MPSPFASLRVRVAFLPRWHPTSLPLGGWSFVSGWIDEMMVKYDPYFASSSKKACIFKECPSIQLTAKCAAYEPMMITSFLLNTPSSWLDVHLRGGPFLHRGGLFLMSGALYRGLDRVGLVYSQRASFGPYQLGWAGCFQQLWVVNPLFRLGLRNDGPCKIYPIIYISIFVFIRVNN